MGCRLDGGLKTGYTAQGKKVRGIWMGKEKVLERQKAGEDGQSGGPRKKSLVRKLLLLGWARTLLGPRLGFPILDVASPPPGHDLTLLIVATL